MGLKKYFIFIIILNFTNFLYADIIKPTKNLTAYDVIKIQLNALKKNNKPNKNSGIKQTWIFAHPENKKITGPYERFQKMLLGDQYNVLLNHESHKINLIMNTPNTHMYKIKILTKDKQLLFYEWHVQKASEKNCIDCWFTSSVSIPIDQGNTI